MDWTIEEVKKLWECINEQVEAKYEARIRTLEKQVEMLERRLEKLEIDDNAHT